MTEEYQEAIVEEQNTDNDPLEDSSNLGANPSPDEGNLAVIQTLLACDRVWRELVG